MKVLEKCKGYFFGRMKKGDNMATTKSGLKKKECMIASQTVQWGDIRVCSITRLAHL